MSSSAAEISEVAAVREQRAESRSHLDLEVPRRVVGSAVVFLFLALAALAGCRQPPTAATGSTAADSGPPEPVASSREASAIYRPLARDRVLETLRATDFELLRCSYRVDDRWYSLDCEVPVADLSPDARRELEAILSQLVEAPAEEGESSAGALPVHLFDLNVREKWIVDLEIADYGFGRSLTIECVSENTARPVSTTARHLSVELKRRALEALLRTSERPRRALPWHALALARLLQPPRTIVGSAVAAASPRERALFDTRREKQLFDTLLRQLLASPTTTWASRLTALLVPSVDLLTDAEISALLGADRIVVRVLPLTRKALAGDAEALREIYRLAMEYGGDPAAFVAAARLLFPDELNPALVARHPPARDREEAALLLATIRRSLKKAEYQPTHAWRLPVE